MMRFKVVGFFYLIFLSIIQIKRLLLLLLFGALQLWYQSHALARSVDPTREDACAHKRGGL